MKKENIRELTGISVMAVVMAVCAWIAFPVIGVQLTMQTMGVFLALRLLGGKNGTAAIALYILLGLVGVPVFSFFNAGPGCLLGPTGGYITGFLAIGALYWALEKRLKYRWQKDAALYAGLLICYALGTAWFIYVMGVRGNPCTLGKALGACVLPFLIPDAIKLLVCELIVDRVGRAIDIRA